MLKTRKKAEANTMQNLPLEWDDKPHEGRKSTVTLQSSMLSNSNHDETAEDAVNALFDTNDEANASAQLQAKSAPQPPAAPKNSQEPLQPQEPAEPEPPVAEEPEILEIDDNDDSLGNALTKLRGALGCSLQDLADKTKIPVQKIRALEEGNYDEISNINMGADYVRKLCIEYVVPAEKYVLKFKEAYNAYSHDEDSSPKLPQPPPNIEIAKQHFISIPSLLIGTLILVIVLLILGGLGKLYFRKSIDKSPANLSELAPVNRGAMTVLPMPEDQ